MEHESLHHLGQLSRSRSVAFRPAVAKRKRTRSSGRTGPPPTSVDSSWLVMMWNSSTCVDHARPLFTRLPGTHCCKQTDSMSLA